VFGIDWPISAVIILDRDGSYRNFDAKAYASEFTTWTKK